VSWKGVSVLSTSGEWADDDFSVACMYAADYRVVGGYNLSAVNFQFDLYQRHVASGLQVTHFLPLFIRTGIKLHQKSAM